MSQALITPNNAQLNKRIDDCCKTIAEHDAEFVCKVALYARSVLNIRTVANYLIARIADTPDCRPYLKKYFAKATNIPSDLLEIADLYAKIVSYF